MPKDKADLFDEMFDFVTRVAQDDGPSTHQDFVNEARIIMEIEVPRDPEDDCDWCGHTLPKIPFAHGNWRACKKACLTALLPASKSKIPVEVTNV